MLYTAQGLYNALHTVRISQATAKMRQPITASATVTMRQTLDPEICDLVFGDKSTTTAPTT